MTRTRCRLCGEIGSCQQIHGLYVCRRCLDDLVTFTFESIHGDVLRADRMPDRFAAMADSLETAAGEAEETIREAMLPLPPAEGGYGKVVGTVKAGPFAMDSGEPEIDLNGPLTPESYVARRDRLGWTDAMIAYRVGCVREHGLRLYAGGVHLGPFVLERIEKTLRALEAMDADTLVETTGEYRLAAKSAADPPRHWLGVRYEKVA